MSIRDDFFAAQAKASLWDVAVSIKRGNPLPLDANSVFKAYGTVNGEDYAGSLLEYATSNPVAYPGQICAVVGADATTIYYLDQNLAIQPVGIIPTGDNKTVEVTANGEISLKGAAAATAGQQPRIVNKGTAEAPKLELEWYTPDNSTVAGLQATVGGLVETVNGVDGDENKPGLVADVNALKLADVNFAKDLKEIADDYVKSADIAEFETKAKVKEVADALADYKTSNDTALAGVKATAEAAAKASDVETALAGKADKSAYDQTVLDLTALANKVNAFLEGTGTEAALDSLQELINYIETHDDTDISGILASIQGIENKLAGIDTTVAAYVTAAIDALAIGDYAKAADLTALAGRVKALEDVDNFTQAEFVAFNATNSAAIEQAKADAIADADAKLANKLDSATFETFKRENTTAIGAAKEAAIAAAATDATTKADKALADAKADTAEQLKSYYTSAQVDNKFDAVDIELDTKQDKAPEGKTYAYTSDIETAVNSLKNNEIKSAQETADAANVTANAANAQASTNKTAIEGINTTIAGHTTKIGENTDAIAALQQADIDHHALYEALLGTVGGHGTEIAGLKTAKADQSALEAAVSRVAANEQAIKTINETTIPAVDTKVEAIKADYLKAADKTELADAIKAIADDYLKAADKAELAAAIKAIADDYLKAADKAELVEDIGEVATRVTTAEGDIDALQETIKGLSGAMHFKGVVASDPTAEDFVTTGYAIGDVVIFGNKEYVFAEVDVVVGDETVKGNRFVEFGDATGNASAISDLDERVETLEKIDHAAAHAATLKDAKDYADDLASNYATADQGAAADTAVQSVTCEAGMGIKATRTENDIVFSWDDTITLVLCGGGAN